MYRENLLDLYKSFRERRVKIREFEYTFRASRDHQNDRYLAGAFTSTSSKRYDPVCNFSRLVISRADEIRESDFQPPPGESENAESLKRELSADTVIEREVLVAWRLPRSFIRHAILLLATSPRPLENRSRNDLCLGHACVRGTTLLIYCSGSFRC